MVQIQGVPFFACASLPPFKCNGIYARAPNIAAVIGHGNTVCVSGGSVAVVGAVADDDDASSASGGSSPSSAVYYRWLLIGRMDNTAAHVVSTESGSTMQVFRRILC